MPQLIPVLLISILGLVPSFVLGLAGYMATDNRRVGYLILIGVFTLILVQAAMFTLRWSGSKT